jgi:hypothetical protein
MANNWSRAGSGRPHAAKRGKELRVPSQLRIYKIKSGLMDDWLAFFRENVVPLHRKFGIPARIAWVDRDANEFIWARDFAEGDSIEAQEQRYVTSEERRRVIGDQSKSFIESMTVRTVHLAHEEPR